MSLVGLGWLLDWLRNLCSLRFFFWCLFDKLIRYLNSVFSKQTLVAFIFVLELNNLLLECLDQHTVGISVDNWFILDVSSPRCVFDCAK